MSTELCGYTVVDHEGIEEPCDRPATGWRWYQDVEHEDMLAPACVIHANEGGRRMHDLEAVIARVEALALPDGIWKGDKHVRLTRRDRSLGCDITESYVRVDDLTAALADPERDEESGR